jgi:hypothetical protein
MRRKEWLAAIGKNDEGNIRASKRKISAKKNLSAERVVGMQGFEPRSPESESGVLPLDDIPPGGAKVYQSTQGPTRDVASFIRHPYAYGKGLKTVKKLPTNNKKGSSKSRGGHMRYPAKNPPLPADRIPLFQGRPRRDHTITKDDVLNLIIALEIHHDVEGFCSDRHLFVNRP